MTPPITLNKDTTSPTLTDTITVDNAPVNLTGATVKFRMRLVDTVSLKVDASATIVTATDGTVSYGWSASDTDTQGEYFAWWHVTLSGGKIQDTPEFKILIDEHASGAGVVTGAIATNARQFMPVSWDALSRDQRYSDRLLQGRVDAIKYKLFATVVTAAAEATVYDFFVLGYLGKVAALNVIPAAIEYWSDQHISISQTGTQESVSYPDRLRSLQELQKWLMTEISKETPDIEAILPFKIRRFGKYPKVSDGTLPLQTADPHNFPIEYGPKFPGNVYIPFVFSP